MGLFSPTSYTRNPTITDSIICLEHAVQFRHGVMIFLRSQSTNLIMQTRRVDNGFPFSFRLSLAPTVIIKKRFSDFIYRNIVFAPFRLYHIDFLSVSSLLFFFFFVQSLFHFLFNISFCAKRKRCSLWSFVRLWQHLT